MFVHTLLISLPLLAMLLCAAVTDLRSRRIPNWLTITLIAGGLARLAAGGCPLSISQAASGMAAGFGLGLFVMLLGGLGGGDVKLLAGVGAWLGPLGVLIVFAGSAVVAMGLTIGDALLRRRMGRLMQNTLCLLADVMSRKAMSGEDRPGRFQSIGRPLPFAVPVLVATWAALLLAHL